MPPRIAFLVLAHGDPSQLERLCRALQPHTVFVHIDSNAADFPLRRIEALPKVTLVKRPINVHWGDFSVVRATLRLIEESQAYEVFDRYVLLSGACYPIKSMSSLEALFKVEPRREWINLTEIGPGSHLNELIGRRWLMSPIITSKTSDAKLRAALNKMSKLVSRDIRQEIRMNPFFGSQWWALTHECTRMILEFVNSHPNFSKAYSSVYAPDEQFFHTIIGNSSFASFANEVDDRGSATNQVMPLHLSSSAADRYWIGGEEEFAQIAESERFFVRKVSSERSVALLDRIDSELLQGHPT